MPHLLNPGASQDANEITFRLSASENYNEFSFCNWSIFNLSWTFFLITEIVIFKYKILSRDKFTHILEVAPSRILASLTPFWAASSSSSSYRICVGMTAGKIVMHRWRYASETHTHLIDPEGSQLSMMHTFTRIHTHSDSYPSQWFKNTHTCHMNSFTTHKQQENGFWCVLPPSHVQWQPRSRLVCTRINTYTHRKRDLITINDQTHTHRWYILYMKTLILLNSLSATSSEHPSASLAFSCSTSLSAATIKEWSSRYL